MSAVWLALPAVLTMVYSCTLVQFAVDFWHRAASGRLMWQTRGLVERDTFTFTIAGKPIVNQNWLAELGLFGRFELGGFPLVQFAAAVCYATAIALVTWLVWRRCGSPRVAAALAIVALVLCGSNLGVRTQALAAVLFAVELAALWCCPSPQWIIVIIGVTELVWANVHGTFPLGVILPGIFLVGMAWPAWRLGGLRAAWADPFVRCMFVATLVAAAAMFCNPTPGKTIGYVLGVASKSAERGIEEWLRTSPTTYAGAAFAVSALAVVVILFLGHKPLAAYFASLRSLFGKRAGGGSKKRRVKKSKRRKSFAQAARLPRNPFPWEQAIDSCAPPEPEEPAADPDVARHALAAVEVLLLVAFAVLACRAQRMVMWWALAMPTAIAPSVAALVARWQKQQPSQEEAINDEERSLAATVILALLVVLAVVSTPWVRAYNPLLPPAKRAAIAPDEPAAAVQFLKQRGYRGRVFNTMEWGGYLSWYLSPRVKIFVDPRIDFYPDPVWNDYVLIGRVYPGWQKALDRRRVNLIVWNRLLSRRLPDELAKSRQWKNVYQDDAATVFVRTRRPRR